MRALRGADPPLSLPPSSDMVVNPVEPAAASPRKTPDASVHHRRRLGGGAGLSHQMCFRGKGQ